MTDDAKRARRRASDIMDRYETESIPLDLVPSLRTHSNKSTFELFDGKEVSSADFFLRTKRTKSGTNSYVLVELSQHSPEFAREHAVLIDESDHDSLVSEITDIERVCKT